MLTHAADRRPLVGSAAARFKDQLQALSFLKCLVILKVQQGSRDLGKAILKGMQVTCFAGTIVYLLYWYKGLLALLVQTCEF